MNERKLDAGTLAEQIESAQRSLESLPEWLRDASKFQGQNHEFDESVRDGDDESKETASE